MDFSENYIGN